MTPPSPSPSPGRAAALAGFLFRIPVGGRVAQVCWHCSRAFFLRVAAPWVARQYLRTHPVAKLHLGASFVGLPGWLNTDLHPDRWPVLRLDASRRFPLPDLAFDFVFSEHMIEHLTPAGARGMLAECHRVLRPGGRIRIATPDLARIIGIYLDPEVPAHRHYIERSAASFPYAPGLPGPAAAFNNLFYLHGHRFIFDRAALETALQLAGFTDVSRHAPGESDCPELAGLEVHHRTIGEEANRLETLVLEARKP